MSAISNAQIKAIKAAQRQLSIKDDDYRAMLQSRFGVTSCTKLTARQAGKLIDELHRLGFAQVTPVRQTKPRRTAKTVTLVSPRELDKIAVLCRLIEWRIEDGYQLWLRKRYRIEHVKTSEEAYKVIEGLKKVFTHQMDQKHGKDWWWKNFDSDDINNFIAEHGPAGGGRVAARIDRDVWRGRLNG